MIKFGDLLAGVSLSTLSFLVVWDQLWRWAEVEYFDPGAPGFAQVLRALLASIIVVGALYALMFGVMRRIRLAALIVLFATFIVVRQAILLWIEPSLDFTHLWIPVRIAEVVWILAVVTLVLRKWSPAVLRSGLVVLAPLLPLLVMNLWIHRSAPESHRAAAEFGVRRHTDRRVVWLLYDELDKYYLSSGRPPSLSLPAIDRLRAESVRVERAVPPAMATRVSIPALLTGRPLVDAQATAGGQDMRLEFADTGATGSWLETGSIFDRASAMGVRSAVVGWFHPYCRVLGPSVSDCWCRPMRVPVYERKPPSMLSLMKDQWALVLPLVPGVARFIRTVAERDAADQQAWQKSVLAETQRRAERLVSDSRFNLVYVHFPIPHPPALNGNPHIVPGYLDNVALVDRSIAAIRGAMEGSGTWNTSALIVTADHPFRVFHWRQQAGWGGESEQLTQGKTRPYVPLIVKLPGETSSVRITKPVYSILVHDLVLEYLSGRLLTHAEVDEWLSRNRNRWGPPALPEHASAPDADEDSSGAAVSAMNSPAHR